MIGAILASALALAPEGLFHLDSFELDGPGRITQRHATDFDGDGLADILLLSNRSALVWFQRQGGPAFAAAPDLAFDLPADAIVFDTGDVDGAVATREIVVLRAASVEAISLVGRKVAASAVVLVAALTPAVRPDPAEVHWRPLCRDFDGDPGEELFLPGENGIDVHRRDGASGAFVPCGSARVGVAGTLEPGGESLHSRFRSTFGYPALHLADVDGDGDTDLVAATLGTISIHLGSKTPPFFSAEATARAMRTGLVSRRDRPSPASPFLVDDADGDGRADLLVVDAAEGALRIHASDGTGFDPEATPRQVLKIDGWILEAALRDVTGDGRRDIVLLSTPEVGVVEGARIVMEKRLRARVAAFEALAGEAAARTPFARTPRLQFERSVPVAFSTGGAARFEMTSAPRPSLEGDFDGDGLADLWAPVDASTLGVFLGTRDLGFGDAPAATLALRPDATLSAEAWLRDLNGDGRTDIVLFCPDFERRRDRVTVAISRP